MPIVIAGFGKRREARSAKPSRTRGRFFGQEWGKILSMTFAQGSNLTINLVNNNSILELVIWMNVLPMLLDPFHNKKREIALGAICPKRGDTKKGRESIRRHDRAAVSGGSDEGQASNDEKRKVFLLVCADREMTN